jgi:hypothetical protein
MKKIAKGLIQLDKKEKNNESFESEEDDDDKGMKRRINVVSVSPMAPAGRGNLTMLP